MTRKIGLTLFFCFCVPCFSFAPSNGLTTTRRTTTQLSEKKWSPRWNPRPDSEYYRRGDGDNDIYGGVIYSGNARRKRRSKFVARYRKFKFLSFQRLLIGINIACFIQQIRSSIHYLPRLNEILGTINFPYELPITKIDILEDMLLGLRPPIMIAAKAVPALGSRFRIYGQSHTVASSLGPFTMDFVNQRLLTRMQPHRYLTSGFLHGNLIHLLFNMRYLWTLPRWVEDNGGTGNGLSGWPLYIITYISSIVMGNIARDYFTSTGVNFTTLCLGSSGGICGLNGLMLAMLYKMKNTKACLTVFKNMGFLILFGSLMDGVSNSSHIGGFVTGCIMGLLFGPNYSPRVSKYTITRDEEEPLEYRIAMGSKIGPEAPSIPLRYFLGALGLVFWLKPDVRNVPYYIYKGFLDPGALSGLLV
jgi:membrane associated rhomboid family serine protease